MSTLNDIVMQVIRRTSQIPGLGTQTYSEDRYSEIVIDTFKTVALEAWWPQHMQWFTRTLDGVTGVITELIDGVGSAENISKIYQGGTNTIVPPIGSGINPNTITTPYAFYLPTTQSTLFTIYSKDTVGTVDIHARVIPQDFDGDTEIPFDTSALVYGATYEAVIADGNNNAHAEYLKSMFVNRVSQLKKQYNTQIVVLDPVRHVIPTTWSTIDG